MEIRRRERLRCVLVALALAASGSLSATAQLLGPEFAINSYTTSNQLHPAVAIDAAGNFVVVWTDDGQEGSVNYGIFGQGFDPAGGALGAEFHVNGFMTGQQKYPAVAASGSNDFLVVWESQGQDGAGVGIEGRRFTASGLPAGSEFQVNTYTTGYQSRPAVATNVNSSFLVVWSGLGLTDSAGVFAQRFNAAGGPLGSEFRVNTYTTGGQEEASVAADGLGNFVVVWADSARDGNNFGVFGQRLDAVGTPVGGDFQINSYTTERQRRPAVAADGAGNFVVTWESYDQDGSHWGVFGQRFNSAGVMTGSEFRINDFTTAMQFNPAVAADASGNFVVAWESYQDGSSTGTFARRFHSTGAALGSEFQVNIFTPSNQRLPAMAVDALGNFVVSWESNSQDGSSFGVVGRRMTTNVFDHGFETNPPYWSATTASMCAGFCDSQSSTGCFCDSFCAVSGDCCLDTCQTCGYCGP